MAASILNPLMVSFDLLQALIKRLSSDRMGTVGSNRTKRDKVGKYILLSIYHMS